MAVHPAIDVHWSGAQGSWQSLPLLGELQLAACTGLLDRGAFDIDASLPDKLSRAMPGIM